MDLQELSPQERRKRFQELIVSGTSTDDAGKLCGYTPATAREYRRRDRQILHELSVEAISDLLPIAVVELRKLLRADSEAVRLNAIQRVLSQAGLDAPTVLNIRALSDAEIDARLKLALAAPQCSPETEPKLDS